MNDFAPLHPTVAEGLWNVMVEIDDALRRYSTGSKLVDSDRVIDDLLAIRNQWLATVMAAP